MKIIIDGDPKEIAALVAALQERRYEVGLFAKGGENIRFSDNIPGQYAGGQVGSGVNNSSTA